MHLSGSTAFELPECYTDSLCGREGSAMRETNDPYADLDDLIFDENDGGPSDR